MDKFCYSAGELEFGSSQCDLCKYRFADRADACQKYEEKPKDIVEDERKCPYMRHEKFLDL